MANGHATGSSATCPSSASGRELPVANDRSRPISTLVYAAKSTVENNAVVLAEWLEDEVEKRAGPR